MRDYTLTVVTPPATEPVTAADAQEHLDITGEATLLNALITAAREAAESYTRRAFITQTLRLNLDGFPSKSLGWWDGVRDGAIGTEQSRVLELPRPPLQSVSSVTYFDTSDASQTFASSNYVVITDCEPGVVQLKTTQAWPVDLRSRNAVKIDFIAGYGAATDVPMAIKRAILLEVASYYTRRNPNIAAESIDNAAVTYVNEAVALQASGHSGLSPMATQLLKPYRVVRV